MQKTSRLLLVRKMDPLALLYFIAISLVNMTELLEILRSFLRGAQPKKTITTCLPKKDNDDDRSESLS
ncbi:hypothetical protein [Paenibacillus woosongensis]|uniref:hypothetical protein n=1 Tax=Paenibacillus woosongensis TaxID=307580 RepID=UPI0012D9606C|nr:hypothetical protein [Paenibacillus woosongensis]